MIVVSEVGGVQHVLSLYYGIFVVSSHKHQQNNHQLQRCSENATLHDSSYKSHRMAPKNDTMHVR